MTEIVLEGQWTKSEFYRALRLAQSWWPQMVLALYVAVISFLVKPHIVWAIVGGGFVLFMSSMSYWVIPSRIWTNSVGSQEPRRVIVSDAGIHMTMPSLDVFYGWERFKRSRETSKYYFLVASGMSLAAPYRKELFQSREDEEQFRALLRTHTKANLRPRRFSFSPRGAVAAVLIVFLLALALLTSRSGLTPAASAYRNAYATIYDSEAKDLATASSDCTTGSPARNATNTLLGLQRAFDRTIRAIGMPRGVRARYAKVVTAERALEVGEEGYYSCSSLAGGSPSQVAQSVMFLWEEAVGARYELGQALHW